MSSSSLLASVIDKVQTWPIEQLCDEQAGNLSISVQAMQSRGVSTLVTCNSAASQGNAAGTLYREGLHGAVHVQQSSPSQHLAVAAGSARSTRVPLHLQATYHEFIWLRSSRGFSLQT